MPDIDGSTFLPIDISTEIGAALPTAPLFEPVQDSYARSGARIENLTADGHRVSIEGNYDGDALVRLLKGLVRDTGFR